MIGVLIFVTVIFGSLAGFFGGVMLFYGVWLPWRERHGRK